MISPSALLRLHDYARRHKWQIMAAMCCEMNPIMCVWETGCERQRWLPSQSEREAGPARTSEDDEPAEAEAPACENTSVHGTRGDKAEM